VKDHNLIHVTQKDLNDAIAILKEDTNACIQTQADRLYRTNNKIQNILSELREQERRLNTIENQLLRMTEG